MPRCAKLESFPKLKHCLSVLSIKGRSYYVIATNLPHSPLIQIHASHVVIEGDSIGFWILRVKIISCIACILDDSVTEAQIVELRAQAVSASLCLINGCLTLK